MMRKNKVSKKKLLIPFAVMAMSMSVLAVPVISGCTGEEDPPITQDVIISVTIGSITNGSVTADKESYVSGDTVTLTITPASGYKLSDITVNGTSRLGDVSGGKLVLTNVTEDITVGAVFVDATEPAKPATVTVTNNDEHGTVTLSKTSDWKVGEELTVTITPKAGYDIEEVKVNNSDKTGNIDADNCLKITLTENVSIVVTYYQITARATVVSNNEFGSASIENVKDIYAYGETIVVNFEVLNNAYELSSVTVNGEERISDVKENKLEITITQSGNVNVVATFTLKPVKTTFNIKVTDKEGRDRTAEKTFDIESTTGGKNYSATPEDGVISGDFVPDTYLITVNGSNKYTSGKLVVEEGAEYGEIWLSYLDLRGTTGKFDTSEYRDGKITSVSAIEHDNLYFEDTYGDFIFRSTVCSTGAQARDEIRIVADGKRYPLSFLDGNALQNPYGDWGWSDWNQSLHYNLSSDLQAKLKAGTLETMIIRRGTMLYVFVEGEIIGSYDVFNKDTKVDLELWFWKYPAEMTKNFSFSFDEEEIQKYVQVNVTSEVIGKDYGSITLNKELNAYSLGETAVITIETKPSSEEGFVNKLVKLEVNGRDVTDLIVNNKYGVKLTADTEIVATFEKVEVASLRVKVKAEKFGEEMTVSKVTVTGTGYSETFELTDGELFIEELPEGTYRISAAGYAAATVEHALGAVQEPVVLQYQVFVDSDYWNTSSYGDGYITAVEDVFDVYLKDVYGNFVIRTKVYVPDTSDEGTVLNRFELSIRTEGKEYPISFLAGGLQAPMWGNWTGSDYNNWQTLYAYTEEEKQAVMTEGLDATIIRNGSSILVYIGEKLIWTYENQLVADRDYELKMQFYKVAATGTKIYFNIDNKLDSVEELLASDVSLTVNGNKDWGNATLSEPANGEGYLKGEIVTVTFAPKDKDGDKVYIIKSATLNGEDIADKIEDNVYTFMVSGDSYEFAVEFDETEIGSLVINSITGLKTGERVNFDKVTVRNASYHKEHALTDGKLEVAEIPYGTYYIEVEGYIPYTVTVGAGTVQEDICMTYQLFNENCNWSHNTLNDGTLTFLGDQNNGYLWTKEQYGDFILKTSAVVNGYGLTSRFEINLKNNGQYLVSIIEDAIQRATWDSFPSKGVGEWGAHYSLTEDEKAALKAGTLEVTVVRKGDKLYTFFGDKLVYTNTFPGAEQKYTVCIQIYDGIPENYQLKGFEFKTDVSELDELLKANVTASVSAETEDFGNITLSAPADGKSYVKGEEVTLTVTLADKTSSNAYLLKSLTLNGKDITAEVSGGKYVFTVNSGRYEFVAEFEEVAIGLINIASISGIKTGNEVNIDKVRVYNSSYDKEHTLTDGALSIADMPVGKYNISADGGYIPVEITVEQGAEKQDDVVLVWQIFNEDSKFDISTFNEGYITNTTTVGNAYAWLNLKEKYTDFVFTATLKNLGNRDEIRIMHGENKCLPISSTDNHLQNPYAPGSWGWSDYDKVTRFGTFTDEEIAKWNGTGIDITVAKSGRALFVYIEDRLSYSDAEAFGSAEEECHIGLSQWTFEKGVRKNVNLSTNGDDIKRWISSTVSAKVTDECEGFGTVALSEPANGVSYVRGENVTVTMTASESDTVSYVIKKLTVNGTDVTEEISGGVYAFTAVLADYDIVAEFEAVENFAVEVSVTFKTPSGSGSPDKVILSNASYEKEYAVADGKFTTDMIPAGRYTVSADGYISETIDVGVGLETATVELVYQIFSDSSQWDTGTFNKGHIVSKHNAFAELGLKDKYTDFTITTTVMNANPTGDNGAGSRDEIRIIAGTKRYPVSVVKGEIQNPYGWGWSDYATPGGSFGALTAAENNEFTSGTLKITVTRSGTALFVFAGDTLKYADMNAFESADAECEIKLVQWAYAIGVQKQVSISTDENDILHWTKSVVTVGESEHGTVKVYENGSEAGNSVNKSLTRKVDYVIEPEAGYTVSSLSYNGADVTADIKATLNGDNVVYTYSRVSVEHTIDIKATFAEIKTGTLTANLSGIGFGGIAQNLAGKTVTVSGAGGYYTGTVGENGLLEIENVVVNKGYELHIDGYADYKFDFGEEEGTRTVKLNHYAMNYINAVNADGSTASREEGAYIDLGSKKENMLAVTNEGYDYFKLEVTFRYKANDDGANRQQGIAVKLGERYLFLGFEKLDSGAKLIYRSSAMGISSMTGWVEDLQDCKPLKADWFSLLNSDTGLKVAVERDGNTVKTYVEGTLVKTMTYSDIADVKANVGVWGVWVNTNTRYDFTFSNEKSE